jgi:ubiquinone biosynthesis protein COQ4
VEIQMKTRHNPIRFTEAWQGIRALLKDPDDTSQVFKIIRALSGNAGERQFERFLASEHGEAILAEDRSLVTRLSDRAYLETLPEGSLGRVYAEFTEREQISPDGLVEASESVDNDGEFVGRERMLFGNRMRDSHDLWHIVTGYGRDLVGEAALLAFTYNQTRNRGIGFIVLVAYLKAGSESPEPRRMIRDGFRRSKRSGSWLPSADWETLLEQPLDVVRKTLGVVPVEPYEALRSDGAPVLA